MAAAGQSSMRPLDFMVRDLNHHKLFGQAIQAMLKEAGIQSDLRTVVESVWFGDAAAGNYDLAVGAIVSTLLDPSDYFNAWYRTDGPQNYSFWHNAEFDKLVDQIDVEVDAGKRLALIRQAEDLMEQDPPLVPVAWEKINDVWYNYVKGHNPKRLFRHLRRGPVRHVLAGQGLIDSLSRRQDAAADAMPSASGWDRDAPRPQARARCPRFVISRVRRRGRGLAASGRRGRRARSSCE